MNALVDAAFGRSRTVLLMLVFILVAGASAYRSIPKEAEPDIAIPFVHISMTHDGISPEDAERLLVRPMETELQSIEGLDPTAAALETGRRRMRPVLLTAFTTVLGLMPMVLAMNIDLIGRDIAFGAPSTLWWTQLSSAIAGGLTFATLLTLVLTPCLLVLGDRLGDILRPALMFFRQWGYKKSDAGLAEAEDRSVTPSEG